MPSERDEDLVALLCSRVPDPVRRAPAAVLERAELHGLTAVVEATLARSGVMLPRSLADDLAKRAAARALDHAAHLQALRRIDEVFAAAGLAGVALKGAALGARYYAVPSGRATSDTDLLVAETDLERAAAALESLGYERARGADEARSRREHHHIHLGNPAGPPLELHFHAYRGFGSVLPAEPLVERRARFAELPCGALGVLEPADELVYLAVHAAGHRFIRLGWLYDLRLVLERMTDTALDEASERARRWGYGRVLALTVELLADTLGIAPDARVSLGRLGPARSRLLRALAGEPEGALARSATRFVYGVLLCDSAGAAARHAVSATLSRARRLRP